MPEGNGEKKGVGALEGGTGGPSGAMEYTTMRANDATFPQSDCVLVGGFRAYKFSNWV